MNEANVRPVEQWTQIFREQTDGSPKAISDRIIQDLWCYGARTNKYRLGDVQSLANALLAFKTYKE